MPKNAVQILRPRGSATLIILSTKTSTEAAIVTRNQTSTSGVMPLPAPAGQPFRAIAERR